MANSNITQQMTRKRSCTLTDHLDKDEMLSLLIFLSDELGYGIFDYDKNEHVSWEVNSEGIYKRLEEKDTSL